MGGNNRENARIEHVLRLNRTLQLTNLGACMDWLYDDLYIYGAPPQDVRSLSGMRFYLHPEGHWFVDCNGLCYELDAASLVKRLDGTVCEIPSELIQAAMSDGGGSAPQATIRPDPPIVVESRDGRTIVTVVNKVVPFFLREERVKVLKEISGAYPLGLTVDELVKATKCSGAVNVFKALEKMEPLDEVLLSPGRAWGPGYRCRWPGEAA